METVMRIIARLQNASGYELIEIIRRYKYHKMFRLVMNFVYNPYIVTGLSNKKINKGWDENEDECDIEANEIEYVFDYLKAHNTGRDEDIRFVQAFIKNQPMEYWETYKQIFTKELKCGVTAKTINKVVPGLIPTFEVMLGEKYMSEVNALEKEKPEIIITQKLDGIRCIAVVEKNNATLFSRQGLVMKGLNELEQHLSKLKEGVYDGELLANIQGLDSKDLYRETVSIVNSKAEDKRNICFNVFDYLPIEDFEKGSSRTPCEQRKVEVFSNTFYCDQNYIKAVPILYKGEYDKNILNELLQEQVNKHNEGLMINYAKAGYTAKRTKKLLKVKVMQSVDVRIVGFEPGKGKYRATLGSILVNYKGYIVKVGSGFTESDREYIWNSQEEVLGKIAEIQYFEETTNKYDDSLSLRFPIFKTLRFDKTEPSYH